MQLAGQGHPPVERRQRLGLSLQREGIRLADRAAAYDDGTTEDHALKNGEHFADYIRRVDVPGSQFAFNLRGRQVRYLAITPQRPERIERIELIKGPDDTAPVVMAVTVETLPR